MEGEGGVAVDNSTVAKVGSKEFFDGVLPHRGRAQMLDAVTIDHANSKKMVGHLHVKEDNPFFEGHYPGQPMLPGYVQLELACLTSACIPLYFKEYAIQGKPAIVKVDGVRYSKPVMPGDDLTITAELMKSVKGQLFYFTAVIKNQRGEVVSYFKEIVGVVVK